MSSKIDNEAFGDLTKDKTPAAGAPRKKFASAPKPESKNEGKEEKQPFTSTITVDNKRRLANYQANVRGGSKATDVLNQALKKFFDAHRPLADVDPADFK